MDRGNSKRTPVVNRAMLALAPLLLLTLPCAGADEFGSAPLTDADRAAASAVARDFVDAVYRKDPERIRMRVDGDGLAARSFGEEWRTLSAEDRSSIAAAAAEVFALRWVSPTADAFRANTASIGEAQFQGRDAGGAGVTLIVDVKVTGRDGRVTPFRAMVRKATAQQEWGVVGVSRDGLALNRAEVERVRGRDETLRQFMQRWLALERGLARRRNAPEAANALRQNATSNATTTATATTTPSTRPRTDFPDAAAATAAYCRLFNAGRIPEACDTFWDFEQLLKVGFGSDLADVSPDQLKEMSAIMRDMLMPVLANKTIGEAFQKAVFTIKESRQIDAGEWVVTVHLFCDAIPGKPPLENNQRVYLIQRPDGWRIYDLRLDGSLSIAQSLGQEYRKVRREMSPLEFVRLGREAAEEIHERARRLDEQRGLTPAPSPAR